MIRTMLLAVAFLATVARCDDRPDILLILCDDLGYGDLSCFNTESMIKTPAFDRVATGGIKLTDSHSPASWCTPTRYSLLTGNYPFRRRVGRDASPVIADDEPTLPGFLRDQGYSTAMIGKWHLGFEGGHDIGDQEHLGGPVDRGFDSYFGIPRSLDIPPYYWIRDRHAVATPTETVEAHNSPEWSPIQGAFWRNGKIAPEFEFDAITPRMRQEAENYITDQGPQDNRKPYFLYVPLPSPHTPWVPTQKYIGRSDLPLYGDFVEQVDGVIDSLVAAVEGIGATENTLVIITSDNGACWYDEDDTRTGHDASGGYRGMKGDAYEGGHRIPTIIRWPKRIAAGSQSAALTCHADFFATIAGLLGVPLPENAGLDSFDLSGILVNADAASTRPDFVEEASRQALLSIRRGDWKLIPTLGSAGFSKPNNIKPKPGEPVGQLYNLADDPGETNNVYAAHSDLVAELSVLLKQRRESARTRP